jgi:hypothetical protein
MRPQSRYLTCVHSGHEYHSLAAIPLENDGEFIRFIGNRTLTRVPIPIKLLPLATFEWKQVNAVDKPDGLDKEYKNEPPGQLWMPDAAEQRTPFTVPRLLTLPTIGFKIFLSLGSRVMQPEFRTAIEQYLMSDATKLAHDNSWGLVLEWLLCAAQAENGKSLVALSLDPVVTADEEEFQNWMRMRLNTTMGHVGSQMTAQTPSPGQGVGQGMTSAVDMGAMIEQSIVAAVQTLTPAASGGGGSTNTGEAGKKDKYSQDKVAALLGFAHVDAAHKLPQFWKWNQASRKSRGDLTDTIWQIIAEDMATWAYDNRCDIDIGVFLKKKTINSIISLWFNPGGSVAQYATAEWGISILAF